MTDFFSPAKNIVERAYFHLKDKKNQIAFLFDDKQLTYEESLQKINSLSLQLQNLSLIKGDSVLILMPLGYELIFILLALMKQGIVPILIDPRLNKKLWKKSILQSNPKIIISHSILIKWHWLLPWTWRFNFLSANKKVFGAKFLNLNLSIPDSPYLNDLLEMNADDTILKTLTSGSTGQPKIISRNFSILESQQKFSCKYLPPLEQDIHLSLYGIGILQSFIHGSTTIISCSFATESIYQNIATFKPTRLSIPPGMLWELIEYCEKNNLRISSLKCVLTGGAPIPLWFRNKLKDFFPTAECYIVFGSTECEPISKLNLKNFQEQSIVGYPVGKKIEELEIIKTPIGKINEQIIYQIALKGPNCASTNELGVLEIGDLASFDDKDQMWLLGRSCDIYNGVPAAYIEELTERIDGLKRALFLRNNDINYLFIEPLVTSSSYEPLKEPLKKVATLASDLGLGNLEVYVVKKIPVEQRHLWKVQRQQVASLLKHYCHDRLIV